MPASDWSYCRVLLSAAAVLSLLVTGQPAWPACNLIPQTEKAFDSVRGAATRPFAAPGEPIEVRLRPCDGTATAISSNPADHLITVVFTPTGGGATHAVVLTAAADCSAVTPLLAGCLAHVDQAQCVSGAASGMQVVQRNNTNYLRFAFPDSAAIFGTALAGPATIAISAATPASLPCQLVNSACSAPANAGLVACVDDFFNGDGTCGRSGLQGTFNHFTALPQPNDFQGACWDTMPPCTLSALQLRMTTDRDGNILVPMDWRGILVRQNQVPVPRLLTATLAAPFPAIPIRLPGRSFVASYTPEGGWLPPIFEPEADATTPDSVISLFGSADAPYTVLRMARRSDTFQQCAGGGNDGMPCNEAADCPSGTCGVAVCSSGSRTGAPCSSDGGCPGGQCGPSLLDLRAFGQNGNGPFVIARLASGVCQEDTANTCSNSGECDGGSGTCVGYSLTAQNPVPLEGLALSPDVFAFAVNEVIDGVPRNLDDDTIDTVITLRDRTTGVGQPLGAPPVVCGIPSSPAPQGRAVIRSQQAPFSFPAVATEGDTVAFLESEATTNNPAPPHVPCDMNGDGDSADAVLRVYKLGAGEVTPSDPDPVGDGALVVNGRALAVSDGRVFFRGAEQMDAAQFTKRISLDEAGFQLSNLSGAFYTPNLPVVSYDGRYVIFDAFDDAVVAGMPAGDTHHIVVRDVRLGTNEVLNINGSNQITPSCFDQTISADGRWALFACSTTNLVPATYPTCSNILYGTTPCDQIFLRDRCVSNGETVDDCTASLELFTADAMGNPGTDHSEAPSVSADGRYVAYVTWAPNLIGTTTTCSSKLYGSGTCPEIVVHDRCLSNGEPVPMCTPGRTIASVATDGTRANGRNEFPVLSANGRVVAFTSRATNLDARDASSIESVFVRDLDAGVTQLVSMDSFGSSANNFAWVPSISADGRFVSFSSLANNLVPGDTNNWDTFVHDRLLGATERVSVSSNGEQQDGLGGGSDGGQLSADGGFVIFNSPDGNLVPGMAAGISRPYVRDRATGTTKPVHVDDAGVDANTRGGSLPAYLSGDGRFAIFPSAASNLVAGDNNDFCDNNNDLVFDENCADVFMRGLDSNSSSGDLSGDGQADDTVLRVMNGSSGVVTTLCPAGQVSVVAGAAAFLRPESAGATSNPGCSGASLAGPVLNDDGDDDDEVVHFVSASNVVQNLRRAATSVVLSAVCAGGDNAGGPCTATAGCPGGTCSPSYLGALVSEAGQNGANFNADNDSVQNDDVAQVYDLVAGEWTNVGQAAGRIDASGTLFAFLTPEAGQNTDLNGDGDKADHVLQTYDAAANRRVSSGRAADDFVVGAEADVCTGGPMVAFGSPEAARCTVALDQTTCHSPPAGCPASKCDLNGDGDCCDAVLHVYAPALGVISTGQAVTPCRLEACDPRQPYRVYGANVKFLTYEIEQNQILNGDGDATDLVLQNYDACKKERRVISAIDLTNDATGGAQDPMAQDPRTEGHVVITEGKRCYQNSTLLLVPATCGTLADCPANATACSPDLIVAAPAAVPRHDSVLVAAKAVKVSIPSGKTETLKEVKIGVRNADSLPVPELPGHGVRLSVEPGDCPPDIVDGFDLDPRVSGDQDNALVAGGKSAAAVVRLRVKSSDFTTHNAKAAARCTLVLRASTMLRTNEDPTAGNNVQYLEVNVRDKNDVASASVHESTIASAKVVKLKISESGVAVTKTVGVKLGNADFSEAAGHDIVLTVADGDCPVQTVAVVGAGTVSVKGGGSAKAKVSVTIEPGGFTSNGKAAPGRCTALLTATTGVGGNSEPSTANNTTHVTIEVDDATDY